MTQEFVTLPREVVEQALEALINEGEFRKLMKPLIEKSIDSIRAALEQPQGEQEPVAFAIFTEAGNARMWSTLQPHVQKLADAEGLTVTPLYTHPQPKREPLTDEQILGFGPGQEDAEWTYEDQLYFARAIENAHNIK